MAMKSWEVCILSVDSLKHAEYRFGDYTERTGRAFLEACKQVHVPKLVEHVSTDSPANAASKPSTTGSTGSLTPRSPEEGTAESAEVDDTLSQSVSMDGDALGTKSSKRLGSVTVELQVGSVKKRLKPFKVAGEVTVNVGMTMLMPEPAQGEIMVMRTLRVGHMQEDSLIGECEISEANEMPTRVALFRKKGKGKEKGFVTMTIAQVEKECKPVTTTPSSGASQDSFTSNPVDFFIEKRNRLVDKYMQVGTGKVANELSSALAVHMRQPLLERSKEAPVVGECTVAIEGIQNLAPKCSRPYFVLRLDGQEFRCDPDQLTNACEADLTYKFLISNLQQDLCIYCYDDHGRNRNVPLGRIIIPLAGVPWAVGDAPSAELLRRVVSPQAEPYVQRFDAQFMPMSPAGDGVGDPSFTDHFQPARKRKDGRAVPGSGMYKAQTFGLVSLRIELALDAGMRPAVRCYMKAISAQLGQLQTPEQEQEQAPPTPDLMSLMQSKVVQQAVRNCERLEGLLKAPARGILRWIRAKPWHGLVAGLSWFAFCSTGLFPPPAWAMPLFLWALLLLNGLFVAFQREQDWIKSRDDAIPVWNEELEAGTPSITELMTAFTKGICTLERSTRNVLGILDRTQNLLTFADGIASVLFAVALGLGALGLGLLMLVWRIIDPTGSWFCGFAGLAACFILCNPKEKENKNIQKDPVAKLEKLNRVLECVPDQPEIAHRFIACKVQCADRSVKIRVTVVGATGLRNADHLPGQGLSDPYCICTIPGKPAAKFQTKVIDDNLNPVWNHEEVVKTFSPGDSLEFQVWDKDPGLTDDFLGKAKLSSFQFYPRGFSGELVLQEAGKGINARLRVVVEVLRERGRAAPPLPFGGPSGSFAPPPVPTLSI